LIVSKEFLVNFERKGSLKEVFPKVEEIIDMVKRDGDDALINLTERFDGVKLRYIEVPSEEIDDAYDRVDDELVDALEAAKENISNFHYITMVDRDIRLDFDYMVLGKKYTPVESAGIYIPGGRASYPSTALMGGLPAKIAGVKRLIACTPPDDSGGINPLTLVACDIVGFDRVYAVGGAQAIAAMAYGTETIKRVEKIAGPGNIYVTAAKLLVQRDVAIDMPAGPSEILVIADESANLEFVSLDIAAQLEHDPSSIAILLTDSREFAEKVEKRVSELIESKNLYTCILKIEEAIELSNLLAPEHLSLVFKNADNWIDKIENAGSVFIGDYSPVAAGDYASGTNHILPTSGYARMYSGLSVETFLKHITYQKIEKNGLRKIGDSILRLAEAEGLKLHKKSVEERLK
jgi:histidinol dehydrogenase